MHVAQVTVWITSTIPTELINALIRMNERFLYHEIELGTIVVISIVVILDEQPLLWTAKISALQKNI